MGLEEEINDLLGNQSDPSVSKMLSKTASLKTSNECENRRQLKQVNDSILKSTMREWTHTIDNPDEQDSRSARVVGVHKEGEKNIWQAHKEFVAKEDSFGGDIMRLLYQDLSAKSSKASEEDKALAEIARLQSERGSRLHHERLMAKSRMGRKIKSKNFHRHMKRREMKEFLKKDEAEQNPDKLRSTLEQFEKIRAEERISLKHKTGGRFAKIQKLRAKYDPIARDALNAMHDKARELTVRASGGGDADHDGSSAGETDTEMIDSISSDGEGEGERDDDDEDDPEVMAGKSGAFDNSSAHKARTFAEKMANTAGKKSGKSAGPIVANVLSTDQASYLRRGNEDDLNDDAMVLGDDDDDDDQSRFKETIYEMYQDDATLAEEFEREKRELVAQEKPEDLQTFLPGWGCWTGAGYEAADRRRKKKGLIRAPTTARKDAKKPHLWVRQGVHDGLKQHLVKTIPYPYNTIEQFELSRKELVSGAFNLQTVHRQLIKPKFVSRAGQPIYPIQKHEKKHLE